MIERKEKGVKASAFSALVLAFASLGDAFLYPFLPVNFAEVGVGAVWVGLLLSVNRFVRIFSNSIIVHATARYGLRTVMLCAAALAVTSTLGYGLASGLLMWLLFRLMWGLAFSGMRIATLGYALQTEKKGFALGVSRSIQEAGPMLSLFLAPLLWAYFPTTNIFFVLAFLSLPALYFAFKLPKLPDKTESLSRNFVRSWPSSLNLITFVSAIIVDGIVVFVLGILFLQFREQINLVNATALAAFYLGYRRICLVVLSPVGGAVADRIGLDRIFNISLMLVIFGLVVMSAGWVGTGAIIIFTFHGIDVAITPASASRRAQHSLAAVAENATWRDIGAAIGTLSGGLMISSVHLVNFLQVGCAAMLILMLIHLGGLRPIFKNVSVWK